MRKITYRSFSQRIHLKNLELKRPNLCQFELTFRCVFHCRYCYTDGYNRSDYFRKELSTEEVKQSLDKVQRLGVIWLCLTGGDPLTRVDFLDIYSYARRKGFIITIFTNGYSVTKRMMECFRDSPPFALDITLNAVTEDLYEKISRLKGSFTKVMKVIDRILKEKIPLKIKTQVTKDNLKELPRIEKFAHGLGLKITPSYILYPRLNGDLAPCHLRIPPQEILNLDGKGSLGEEYCLFPCAISGGDGFYIDPYGHVFLCNLIRKPQFNLLEIDLGDGLDELLHWVRGRKFLTDSRCRDCRLKKICGWCPGRAYLEKKDLEAPVDYYCRMAGLIK